MFETVNSLNLQSHELLDPDILEMERFRIHSEFEMKISETAGDLLIASNGDMGQFIRLLQESNIPNRIQDKILARGMFLEFQSYIMLRAKVFVEGSGWMLPKEALKIQKGLERQKNLSETFFNSGKNVPMKFADIRKHQGK